MPSIALPVSLRGQLLSGSRFSPLSLFTASEPGLWYDPSDLTTLFQDTAGTTPVTTPGQTVALVLDKSKGLALGSELRALGSIFTVGAPAFVATYSTVTGAGTSYRTDASNTSGVLINVPDTDGLTLLIDLEVSTGTVQIRTDGPLGAVLATISVGRTTLRLSNPTANMICLCSGTNGAGNTFTLHSIRELPGNHATQATAASRPTYGIVPLVGRRNLLTFTEQFDNAFWTKNGSTVSLDGADWRLIPTATTSTHGLSGNVTSNAGVVHTLSFEVQTGYTQWARLAFTNVADRVDAWFDLTNITKGSYTTSASMTYVNHTITNLGNGWRRITLSVIPVNAGGTTVSWLMRLAQADLDVGPWLADGTSFNRIGRPQLELGSTATNYQRVVTTFDVTEAGVQSLSYLSFDGVDDFLVTSTITPGTDKVQIFAGLRKLSDVNGYGILIETGGGSGTFTVHIPFDPNTGSLDFTSRGTLSGSATVATGYPAPLTTVFSGLGDISGDRATLRLSSAQVAQSTADQGTGNYLANAVFIGRRAGTSLPFSGNIYNLIARFGPNLDSGTIVSVETFINGKTGAY